jgi:predicted nucleic acid-binding protein
VTQKSIKKALSVYETIPIRYVDVDLASALDIAGKNNMYAYDAYLVRCALQYTCPLITLDKALIRVAKDNKVKIVEV